MGQSNSQKKYQSLPEIYGFNSQGIYDTAIQFWLNYWQEQGVLFPNGFDPLIIKAIIAVESGFDPNARTKSKVSTASGLMQITNQALRIRWLGHKCSKIPKNFEKNSFNTIKNYHSWNGDGDLYLEKIKELYEKSKK